MIRIALKLLLLSWVVTAKMEDEFEEPEDARAVPPKTEILRFNHSEVSPSNYENEFQVLQRQQVTSEEAEAVANVAPLVETVFQQLKDDTGLLFEAMEACREKHPSTNNRTFNLQLYGGLLGELLSTESEASKATLRRCNISEELVGKLKAKLSQLEIFQDVFVPIPRNNSSESPEHEKSTQQPNPPASRINSLRNLQTTAVENNLKLKLGDEWIPLEPKISHLSHIYLGSSIYPILTEESRVLDKEHTVPGPTPTEDSPTRETDTSAWLKDFGSDADEPSTRQMHQSEFTARLQDTKAKNPFRLRRSVEKKSPKYLESSPAADAIGNRLFTSSTDTPHRLYLFPRKSYHWYTKDDDKQLKGVKCPLDLNEFGKDPRYKMMYKLCSAILQHFQKFLKAKVLKKRMSSED